MLKVTYCTTQDGIGNDESILIEISLLKGVSLYSHYSSDFGLIDWVCNYLNILQVQIIRISID
jgi:hypothetical protein